MKGEKNVGWQPETQPKGKPPVEKTKGAEKTQRLIDANELKMNVILPRCGAKAIIGDAIRKMIDSAPTIDTEPHWIPCSERLPEVRQWVLCQCRAGIMDVLRLTAEGSWYKGYPNTEYMGGFVVAWMPLPKPYEVNHE